MTSKRCKSPVFGISIVIALLILHVEVIYSLPGKSKGLSSIRILPIDNKPYISCIELAEKFGLKIDYTPSTHSMTLSRGTKSLTIHNRSRFAYCNGSVQNLMAPAKLLQGALYAPAATLLPLFSELIPGTLEWNEKKWTIFSSDTVDSVKSITYDDRTQGTLIRINLTEPLNYSGKLQVIENQKWFQLYLENGVLFTDSYLTPSPSGMVQSVRTYSANNEAVIAFRVSDNIESFDIQKGTEPNEMLISLRERRPIAQTTSQKPVTGDTAGAPLESFGDSDLWVIDTIVIDPGHGGKDSGAIGPNGTKEKEIVLAIARELKKIADKRGEVKTVLTRDEDVLVPLHERAAKAIKANGKLFVSIHANAAQSQHASGMEVFFLSVARTEDAKRVAERENASINYEDNPTIYSTLYTNSNLPAGVRDTLIDMASNQFLKESQSMCAILLDNAISSTNQKYRGVKQAGFYVMKGTQASMPSVLFEIGFISNPEEEKMMRRASYQKRIAESIYDAIIEFKEQAERDIIKVTRNR
ncbi:MAG: N-acetylmuramoyl-L-alanine amidase [Candidatus Latescibacteria bacterium]|nr:N-acetylmuramoyl-L-alanine amidase [Candidatus Latescibacterota bacterium]